MAKMATRRKRVTKRKHATRRKGYKRRTVKRVVGGWVWKKGVVPVGGSGLPVARPIPSATPVSKSFLSRFRKSPQLAAVTTVPGDVFAKVETVAAWEEAERQKVIDELRMKHQSQKTDDAWKDGALSEDKQIKAIAEMNYVDSIIDENITDEENIDGLLEALKQWRPTDDQINRARNEFMNGRRVPIEV